MPVRRRRPAAPFSVASGPWRGVRTTTDPFDDPLDLLYDACNLYLPDPQNQSGAFQRPGMALCNNGAAVTTSGSPFRGQGAFSHTSLSDVVTTFVIFNGTMYRAAPDFSTFTDVSPVGITIDPTVTTRVYGTSFEDQLIVTDGVNPPWLASDLTATPITGTPIDFDGMGTAWAVFGPFTIYGGSAFAILASVGGVAARTDITWSAPGDAATGYEQDPYDFRWTLEQTATDPLFAIQGTNAALLYWRQYAIGSISGTPGPDLAGAATHDNVSNNVGTQAPQNVVLYGDTVYFTDAQGRPYRLQPDSDPEPIWLQLRQIADALIASPGVAKLIGTAAFDPTLGLYVVAPWSGQPAVNAPAFTAYAFQATTGVYFGRYQIVDGAQLETLATVTDATGRGALLALGSLAAPSPNTVAASGYVWLMNPLSGVATLLTTEDGITLTTEDGMFDLATEGTAAGWLDGVEVPVLTATTNRLGYSATLLRQIDRVTALVGTIDPVTVSTLTTAVGTEVEGTPTPVTTQDGVNRLIIGTSGVVGRGVQVTVQPDTVSGQWSIQQILADGTTMVAAPDEP